MILNAMIWRKEHKIDEILLEDFTDFERQYPFIYDGSTDKDGRPIAFATVGIFDLRKLTLSGQSEKFLRYAARFMEASELTLNELNKDIGNTNMSTIFVTMDMNNFNLRQHGCIQCIQLLGNLFKIYENYYPSRFYRVFIINGKFKIFCG